MDKQKKRRAVAKLIQEYASGKITDNKSALACADAVITLIQNPEVIRIGRLTANLDAEIVYVDEEPIHLTRKEYQLFAFLSTRKNHVISRDCLMDRLYGGIDEPDIKIIDIFIYKLRKKLNAALAGSGNCIISLWGRGYMLKDPDDLIEAGRGHLLGRG